METILSLRYGHCCRSNKCLTDERTCLGSVRWGPLDEVILDSLDAFICCEAIEYPLCLGQSRSRAESALAFKQAKKDT